MIPRIERGFLGLEKYHVAIVVQRQSSILDKSIQDLLI
jgi:hypothetical protein